MIRTMLRAAAIVLAIAAGAWVWSLRPQDVTTAELVRGDAAEVVYATGVVEPVRWAKVAPLRRGRIVATCRCEGRMVLEGEVLFRLDATELHARIAELEARLDFAEKELARAEGLFDRRVATRETLEERISTVNEYRAMLGATRTQLAEMEIRAPMAGQVLRLDGEVGEVVELAEILAWVGQARPLQVVAEVNEEDIPRIREGQPALILADAFPARDLPATVASITPKGDPELKTYRVYLALPDDTPLFIGMSVDVNVVIRIVPNAVLAPAPAVTEGALFTIEDGRAHRLPVETGIRGAGVIQITAGAEAGMRVVSPVPPGLTEGARLRDEGGR